MEKLIALLNRSGVEEKLQAAGVKEGETVVIGEVEFVYNEER